MSISQNNIRNFCIISHIDHGKSTLADRFLEITNSIRWKKVDRIMDSLELEKERGITIKLNTAQMIWSRANDKYLINLIDTPGHIDFTYEVSRSLRACQGAILLIDASKGIQAQTITNWELAKKINLKIIIAINKIDLKNIELSRIKKDITHLLKIKEKSISLISAKTNEGVEKLLARVVNEIPAPQGKLENPLKALIFDGYYDKYQGVTGLIYVEDGFLKKKMLVKSMITNKKYQITNLQIKTPELKQINKLKNGEVGLFQANIRKLDEIYIGDTLTNWEKPTDEPLIGYQKIKPVVFANFFPIHQEDYKELADTIAKIKINDNAFQYEQTNNNALGNGFHCGFLGFLHLEIIQCRMEKEYNVATIITTPTVKYKFVMPNEKVIFIDNLSKITNWQNVQKILEPICEIKIMTPINYLGTIMQLIKNKRGLISKENIMIENRCLITAEMPLAEIITDFFESLKSVSNGYASFDYQITKYQENDLIKLNILINNEKIEAFAQILHRSKAYAKGKQILEKLKTSIKKHNFQISLQAAINNKIIARNNISALRKNVTAKCYGGDITRKRKLWEKQKKGKEKMKRLGKVDVSQKVFFEVFKK